MAHHNLLTIEYVGVAIDMQFGTFVLNFISWCSVAESSPRDPSYGSENILSDEQHLTTTGVDTQAKPGKNLPM